VRVAIPLVAGDLERPAGPDNVLINAHFDKEGSPAGRW
jgi:hypothetical protein